ncbi:MAG: ATP-binding protein [Peptostreptococcus sp.]|uniref:sensor histidine kinase n=1 Tax=Peptostreptococcus sp. TaxID=1262 RepID=UPI002FC845D2
MKKKILIRGSLITFIAVFASMCIWIFSEHKNNIEDMNRHMNLILTSLSEEMDSKGTDNKNISKAKIDENIEKIEDVHRFEDQYRFTWIDSRGNVIYDSSANYQDMENHSDREEVKNAMKNQVGVSKRYSKTLDKEYRYYAYKNSDSSVIRISTIMVSTYKKMINSLLAVIIITTISTLITMVILSRILKKSFESVETVVENVNKDIVGKQAIPVNGVEEELLPLIEIIDRQRKEISCYVKDLKARIKITDEILDNMNEGLIMLDEKDNIVAVNRSAINLLDSPDINHIGMNIISLVREKDFIEAIELNKSKTIFLSKNEKYLNLFVSELSDSDESMSGKIIFIIDNTQNYIEEKYRREFSANISHELKTPLTSINGYAEIIAAGMADEYDVRGFAKTILIQGRKLLEMIDDIIKLSRLDEEDSEDINLDKVEVDINKVADSVVSMVEGMAMDKDIDIEFYPRGEVKIKSVESMIEEILYNLMTNAIDYNIDGGRIRLEIEDREDDIKISVSDTGIGMKEEDLSRIFERFYMVDKARNKNNSNSTGLGLAIVKHIVKRLGGRIDVKSEIGKGTTMEIFLTKNIEGRGVLPK